MAIAIIGYFANKKVTCDAWAKELNGARGSESSIITSAALYNQKCAAISGMMRTTYHSGY